MKQFTQKQMKEIAKVATEKTGKKWKFEMISGMDNERIYVLEHYSETGNSLLYTEDIPEEWIPKTFHKTGWTEKSIIKNK